MLAVFERYFATIQNARGTADLQAILRTLAADLGFRGGFLIEYGDPPGSQLRAIDGEAGRESWWTEYLSSPALLDNPRFDRVLAGPELIAFDPSRFGPEETELQQFVRQGDLLEGVLVPVGRDGVIIGAVGLRGNNVLDANRQQALLFVAYNLFAQYLALQGEFQNPGRPALTRREREVIRLSAEGMTSQQIGVQLGMSARTANQHFDNVADKLGTRNRAHTVAEAIRRGLLD